MTAAAPDLTEAFRAIADDHARLLELVERIQEGMGQPAPDRSAIGALLDSLVVSTREHFAREEELMADSTLAEFVHHRQDHRYLLRVLSDFATAFRSGTVAASVELTFDLENWLCFHIERFDSRLHDIFEQG